MERYRALVELAGGPKVRLAFTEKGALIADGTFDEASGDRWVEYVRADADQGAVEDRDALLAAIDGIVRAAVEHGVNDQVGEALAYADKIVARRVRGR